MRACGVGSSLWFVDGVAMLGLMLAENTLALALLPRVDFGSCVPLGVFFSMKSRALTLVSTQASVPCPAFLFFFMLIFIVLGPCSDSS